MNSTSQRRSAQFTWHAELTKQLTNQCSAILLRTDDGDMETIYHAAPGAAAAVVWVGGAGGGLDGPAQGLYPEGCDRLLKKGISGLRLDYRYPNDLYHCLVDVAVGVEFLRHEKISRIALVGHSFGGAVVVTAGAQLDLVKAVIPLSTQTYGTELASKVAPKPMLIIHGTNDEILPDGCSKDVFRGQVNRRNCA